MRRLPSDRRLTLRMAIAVFSLAAVYLLFVVVLLQAGMGFSGLIPVVAVMLLAQYYLSDRLVLWGMGAREVSRLAAPELHAMVGRLSAAAGIPQPRVAVVETPMPNAFATGRSPRHAVVAVTTGLLEMLEPREVEAVLAHEISHIKHRDAAVLTVASFFATVAAFVVRQFMFWGVPAGGGKNREGQGAALVYLVSLLVWAVSYFLIRALSRYREFAADRGSALLTGSPGSLASALVKISGGLRRAPAAEVERAGVFNAFFIVPTLSGESLLELFSTHPSLERRLAYLRQLEREMGLVQG